MSRSETAAHLELKKLAFAWAQENGFPIAACEVRIPASGYRADVAACSLVRKNAERAVALFECKQSRADLLRDRTDEPAARERNAKLGERLARLRALIAEHRPDLRRGDSLFPEFDDYDLRGLQHEGLYALEKEIETLQRKLVQGVKFSRLRRYHAATYLYLVTEADIVAAHEVPLGWGWLVREGGALVLRAKPVRLEPASEKTTRWLEALAAACARATASSLGLRPASIKNGIP